MDFVIDDDKSDIPVYEPKCDGDEITQDNIINIPNIRTIVASEHVGCDYMFLDLPEDLSWMKLKWELSGVILKNECHFRGIIKKTDTIWSLYDGMKTGLIKNRCYGVINERDHNFTRRRLWYYYSVLLSIKEFGSIWTKCSKDG